MHRLRHDHRSSTLFDQQLHCRVSGWLLRAATGRSEAPVLPPDYQRIMSVLESGAGREGMRCQQLAEALGFQAVPAKVEGLRSKARRLVERGVLQVRPGVFTPLGTSTG
ncbi:hypothetical protein M878_31555 [Streptomyces roseochromogenus subsp. oscitans DS 12.976]|uniref:Uncharacterized protein n=1 Tax=Streptomyces roseochromogenus subsp. oscitans DS 12.976 TaxID=1352936 RepID=V6K5J3_STRRC|nr:hypothetical protein M878_31555 [Streptomyces roseochromogenus subsp. oscitans DS 12.976]